VKSRLPKSFLLAVACGVLPLLAGPATLVWWWQTRSDASARALVYVFTLVVIVLVVGTLSLIASLGAARRQPISRTVVAAVLLIVNVVFCYLAAELVSRELRTNKFTFVNASGGVLEDLELLLGEEVVDSIPRLAPGAAGTLTFSAREQELEQAGFRAFQAGEEIAGEIGVEGVDFSKVHMRVVCHRGGRYEIYLQTFTAGRPDGPEWKLGESDGN
jgi:hypothetical protein